MGAPREVWLYVSDGSDGGMPGVWETRKPGSPGTYRYVLARPKREAVSWVVRRDVPLYYMGHDGVWDHLQFARRFHRKADAREAAMRSNGAGARIVKLVRPVKP